MRKLKLLVVTGSFELGCALRKVLETDNSLVLVAEARDAYSARDKIIKYEPDVMLLGNDLPRMSGVTFLERLIPQYHIPAVMLADSRYKDTAYDAGAADFVAFNEHETNGGSLIERLVYDNIGYRIKKAVYPNLDMLTGMASHHVHEFQSADAAYSRNIIAIGASTGGTEALVTVMKGIHKDAPGIVIVQHMPEGYTQMYAKRLDNECDVSVKEAKTGDIVQRGQVLLAPGDKQMRIVKINHQYQVECHVGPKVSGHCPSVDVLFESVARVAGKDAIGVLLTGMGRDGAQGLLEMRKAGAYTIGQDEKSCIVYGMPKAAFDIGAVTVQVPLEQISQKIYYELDKKY